MSPLQLGFSPCPNDTFIFSAIINQQIDTEGISFIPIIEDVETLNRRAFHKELEITKLSYHAYAYLTVDYILLNSGSALGNNCGPLLISGFQFPVSNFQNNKLRIAIPGKYTTANFLLSLFFPKATNKIEMIFSEIENAILAHRVDAGAIIHENRFTYQNKGLKKIVDLGEMWENETGLPIPLGGIVIKRNLPSEIQKKVNRILRRSVEFAMQNPTSVLDYVRKYSQEMDEEVIAQHINLYVNNYTIDLGEKGKQAVEKMLSLGCEKKPMNLFVE